DKILILEDADADGTFETRKVFIEGLNLVSGLEVGFGGVWVGAAPYLMFIPDKDRDDKPDSKPRILLDGFGYHDTHETLNSFTWGPDGWLYGCHGVFTHSHVGKPGAPDEERTAINAGVWRYHPTRHEFEVFAHGTSNPWGIAFDEHGRMFITACVIPHLYHVVQGGRFQRQAGQHFDPYTYADIQTIADHAHYAGNIRDHAWWGRNEPVAHNDTHAAGGGHAHCGAMIYLGDNWPKQYRGTIFMSNIHGNRINNDVLTREGSGFVGAHAPDFLFANDRWFRGIDLQYGPDGGVYLIDWYDENACHRPQSEIWDRTNGRIYKITFGETQPMNVDLGKLRDQELIKLLDHKNAWYARTARRTLQERAAAIDEAPELTATEAQTPELLNAIFEDHPDPTRRLRALWTLHAMDMLSTQRCLTAMEDDNEFVRAWGIQLLTEQSVSGTGVSPVSSDPPHRRDAGATDNRVLQRFVDLSRNDQSPVVRLSLASALQRLPLEQRWDIAHALLAHGEDAGDHNLPLMIWYGVEPLVLHDLDRSMTLAEESRIPLVSRFIIRRAAADEQGRERVLTALGETQAVERQRMILDELVAAVKARAQLKMPENWPDIYAKLSKSDVPGIREQAQFITVKFGDKSIFPALRSIVGDSKATVESRQQALSALLAGQDAELPLILHRLLEDSEMRGPAIRGLARYGHPATPRELLSRYKSFSADERDDAVATLTSRKEYSLALLDAIEEGLVPRDAVSAFQARQMQRFGEAVTSRLNTVWGTIRETAEDRQQLIAEYQQKLNPDVLADADLPHGRAVYKKTCAKCHKLFGDGGDIGPDITGSNRANLDYILENLLDPSAVVGRQYQMTVLALIDGRVVSGLIREENESAITVQTVNEEVVVPTADIEERAKSTLSMMPDGQLKQMTSDEVRDLVAYLGSPSQVPLAGEVPPLDATTGRVPGAIEGESLKVLETTAGAFRSQ
ncbi:MAG: PVC-type heme-binding CxxCH protein, partial [Planctomycetaceae bacterium]